MKNLFNVAALFCLVLSGTFLLNSELSAKNNYIHLSKNQNKLTMSKQISWNPYPGAVSYIVELENTATQATYEHETTDTSINLVGIPAGTYALTVKAKLADGSTTIIIEDELHL